MPTLRNTTMRVAIGLFLASVACSVACSGPDQPATTSAQCEQGDVTVQRRGTNCACCHSDEFGVSGSVDPSGPAVDEIHVTDQAGTEFIMAPNAYGNFFRHYKPTLPLRARLVGPGGERVMKGDVFTGSCNSCHRTGGSAGVLSGR